MDFGEEVVHHGGQALFRFILDLFWRQGVEGLGHQVRCHDGFDESMVVVVEFGIEKGTCFHFFDFHRLSELNLIGFF